MWRLRHNQYESGEDPNMSPTAKVQSPLCGALRRLPRCVGESQAQGHHEAGASPVPASQVGF